MSVRMMHLVWHTKLTAVEKVVMLGLADCANDTGLCWPSIATLADKCSLSERSVQRSIKALEANGHLTRKEVLGRGCKYNLHPRHTVTPDTQSPVTDSREPPTHSHPTPDCVSPKPSMNHKEPPEDCSSDDERLKPEHVLEAWNEMAAKTAKPVVRSFTPERRASAKARIAQFSVDDFATVFANVENSQFLRDWRGCGFDWVMKKANFLKILEGNYNG